MASERPRGWRRPLWWLYRHEGVLDGVASLSWPPAWLLAFAGRFWPSVGFAVVHLVARRGYSYTMSTRLRLAVAIAARNAQPSGAGPPGRT